MTSRLYLDHYVSSIPKKNESVCGDVFSVERQSTHTLFVLCDGMGSGIKANIAANMCCERIKKLSAGGLSLRKIFERMSSEMERAKTSRGLYCSFCAAVLLPDGKTTAAAYDMPMPFMLEDGGGWFCVKYKSLGLFDEANFILRENDALCFVSDGITQAGMGAGGALGGKGALNILNSFLHKTMPADIARRFTLKAKEISGDFDDDTTAAVLFCRRPNALCVFSGPPLSKEDDEKAVGRLLAFEGRKAVCGSTTIEIFCRVTGRKPKTDVSFFADFMPPEYEVEGLDFASEGAITLNQCFNILGDARFLQQAATPPAKLANLLNSSDIICFIEGMSVNKGHEDIMFKQMGILPRKEIIYKISKTLTQSDKIVCREEI